MAIRGHMTPKHVVPYMIGQAWSHDSPTRGTRLASHVSMNCIKPFNLTYFITSLPPPPTVSPVDLAVDCDQMPSQSPSVGLDERSPICVCCFILL